MSFTRWRKIDLFLSKPVILFWRSLHQRGAVSLVSNQALLEPKSTDKLPLNFENAKNKLYKLIQVPFAQRNMLAIAEHFEYMQNTFNPNIRLFNILLRGAILLGNDEQMRNILGAIRTHQLRFNLITYNLMLSYYRDRKCPEEAVQLFERMRGQTDVTADLIAYTTLISALAGHDLNKARAYFEEARKQCSPLDVHCYNALIHAHILEDDYEGASRLVREMSGVNVGVDGNVDFNMDGNSNNSNSNSNVESGSGTIQPNHVTWKSLLKGLVRRGLKEQALVLYDRHLATCSMMKVGDYAEIMEMMREKSWWEEASNVARDMEMAIGHLNSRAAIFLIRRSVHTRDWSEAQRLVERYAIRRPDHYRPALLRLLPRISDMRLAECITKVCNEGNQIKVNTEDNVSIDDASSKP